MIERFTEQFRLALPLRIANASWKDEVLLLSGLEWSFSTMSAWRITSKGVVIVGCYDDVRYGASPVKQIQDLVNQEIVSVEVQGRVAAVDPVFKFSRGTELEVFSTDTFEPWVARFYGKVWVASPSDPNSMGQ